MKKLFALTATLFVQAALIPSVASAAVNGEIKVVSGTVYVNQKPMSVGQVFEGTPNTIVENKSTSDAGLAFSNGSLVTLIGKTSITVQEYTQAKKTSFSALKGDQNKSTTSLKLNEGELLGQTKNLQKQSKFEISGQMGLAGVRGSIVHALRRGGIERFANVEGDIYSGPLAGPFTPLQPLGFLSFSPSNPLGVPGTLSEQELQNLEGAAGDTQNNANNTGNGDGDEGGSNLNFQQFNTPDPTLNPSD